MTPRKPNTEGHEMTNNNEKDASGSVSFPKSAQSVLTGLILATLLWVGNTLSETRVTITRLEVTVEALRESFADKAASSARQLQVHEKQFDTIWPRLREMQDAINELAQSQGLDIDWRRN